MATKKINLATEVTSFLAQRQHPLLAEIELLRILILSANSMLVENIKWNAPNYCLHAQDRITMHINSPQKLQLILHCGAKVKVQSAQKLLQEDFGLLVWRGNDRAIATFNNAQQITDCTSQLTTIINQWLLAAQ
jgi:Domain of unknown function (DU1801)